MNDEEPIGTGGSRLHGGLIVAVIVVVALVVFVFQNTDETKVEWLVFESDGTPVWLVIVVSAVAGALLSEVAGWMIRRRRRDRDG